MFWIVAVLMLLFSPIVASADVDYNCVSRCMQNGFTQDRCTQECTYDFNDTAIEGSANQPINTTCISNCTAQGNTYGYCKKECR